jgi:hypothetical protein
MSTDKLVTPDHPASASLALSSLSRRRFLSDSIMGPSPHYGFSLWTGHEKTRRACAEAG